MNVEVGEPRTTRSTESSTNYDHHAAHHLFHHTAGGHYTDSYVHGHRSTAMRLADDEVRARLAAHDHGILCTVHAKRGVDAVPVAYVMDEDGYVGVPVDRVKPKASLRLQRERNLDADPRATLLVEHWDRSDWSQLWWVRAELLWQGDAAARRARELAARLAERYPQYQDQPFARVVVLRIVGVAGWAAGDS